MAALIFSAAVSGALVVVAAAGAALAFGFLAVVAALFFGGGAFPVAFSGLSDWSSFLLVPAGAAGPAPALAANGSRVCFLRAEGGGVIASALLDPSKSSSIIPRMSGFLPPTLIP